MHFIDFLLLIAIPLISGGFYFIFKTHDAKKIKLVLTFSGAYLFAISVIHLMPEIFAQGSGFGVYILIGFLLQVILEFFSEGIEHGHFHLHEDEHQHKSSLPWVMLISLSIHATLEAMPLTCHYTGFIHKKFNPLLLGIVMHNIPIAYALAGLLHAKGNSTLKSMFVILGFTLMAPIGMYINLLIKASFTGELTYYYNVIMALVIGVFLHISTTILFEFNKNHRFDVMKLIMILLGSAFALFV